MVAVADREPGERSPSGGDAMTGAAGKDHGRENEAEDEDPDGPPERRGVAVDSGSVRQARAGDVTGRVARDGAGEDR